MCVERWRQELISWDVLEVLALKKQQHLFTTIEFFHCLSVSNTMNELYTLVGKTTADKAYLLYLNTYFHQRDEDIAT